MAHKNREKRAARKARDIAESEAMYGDCDSEYEDDDEYEYEGLARRRRGPHPAVVALIVTVVIVVGVFIGLNAAYSNAVNPVDPGDTTDVVIEIPSGASTTSIASILKESDLIGNEMFFKIHCRRMGYDGQFKPGSYTLNKSMSADEISAMLMQSATSADTKRFTIPEGYNITQIARTLGDAGIVNVDEFMEEVRSGVFNYEFLEGCPPGDGRLEGFLYPETYEVYADATAHDVIDKMLGQFDALLTEEYRVRAQERGISVRDIVTMASIVEREAVVAVDRPLMAGVFYNRLEQGMKLESCATIQYILGEPKEFLTNEDTQIESPYNTYLYGGLPPGPICNPRIEAIEAALYPEESDYIYFVLSDALDGSHKFSSDYNEFLQNKDAYYAAAENR